ncbi:unnamed protein product [Gongylonema pulchrum]|uniref:DUF2283 domain-containing protein n=1 Tax=Gongylonema pulchrum TaxID=637853 RepID=A0A183D1G6_9BILA|nr:unnamed protein product [Gongylonema pulchrum]
MKTANVSWDQYIAYTVSESESQPAVISIDFKTEVKEGLIIHGTVLSLKDSKPIGDLKLALIYGQLRLTIAEIAEINFDNVILSSDK